MLSLRDQKNDTFVCYYQRIKINYVFVFNCPIFFIIILNEHIFLLEVI